jgi:phosphoenolpyruvate carboxykinase (ATP)
MRQEDASRGQQEFTADGLTKTGTVWRNLSTPALYEQALQRREGLLAHHGPLVVRTGEYTGRSPEDRFLVREPSCEGTVWWGKINRPFDPARYDSLRTRLVAYLQGKDLFVQDCYAGADPAYRMPIRIITETAWHSLFARNMFLLERDPVRLAAFAPAFTVINSPGFRANPETDGTRSDVAILINLGRREILIGGTLYAGEIKKTIFTVMGYLMPRKGVLPMHCSANSGGGEDDMAIFFGLSGTGKTSLSADPERTLIGDDEHGWSDRGVFNFERGCYAKVIRLSPEAEPEIHGATRRFGTILENVAIDPWTRRIDLDDDALTENTRASYPLTHILNASRSGTGGHPRYVIMLATDAFGVLPPVASLSRDQALYHFLSGYTAKVAGTERGVTEPQATFSACFGEPFMALNPVVYANLLGERIVRHGTSVWLVNTGWSGGPYGVGERISIAHTRALLHAILRGDLRDGAMREDPVFGFRVPKGCPGVPSEILDPRATWADKAAYDLHARRLAGMFEDNFARFADDVPPEVCATGPRRAV